MKTAIYLRKSRADEEREKTFGQGETLSIHRKELLSVAKVKKLDIIKIHEELVTGESLLRRPAMLELLKEVEDNIYDAVLVMDHQRLGRGDLEEQGIILKAFKKSNTKIITPDKVYDLNNEFDEEYSEFEAFMSRKEYKMINKRLQRGVIHSIKEGNYNATNPPFGYDLVLEKKARSLKPNENAKIVKMIFTWYTEEHVGSQIIAERLNEMGIKTTFGNKWSATAIALLIRNQVYIGKITWRKSYNRYSANKKKSIKARPAEDWIIVDGKHDPIVDAEIFKKANEYMDARIKSPLKPKTTLNNALAGIVVCGICGYVMYYRPYTVSEPHLICKHKCGNKSSKFKYVEEEIIKKLREFLANINVDTAQSKAIKTKASIEALNSNISILEKEIGELLKQKESLYDFLERGIYTPDVFIERSKSITQRIEINEAAITSTRDNLQSEIGKEDTLKNIIPKIEKVLNLYPLLKTPDEKNKLLKSVLISAIYTKSKKQRNDDFEIRLDTRF